MALQQSKITEIYPNRKPFSMEPAADNKRKAADLRVQALLGAQEAAKRQCLGGMPQQEQLPPAQDFLQQQNSTNHQTPTDFSGFFHQLQQEKQHGGHPSSILQHAPPQHNLQGVHDSNLQQQQQQQQYTELGGARTFPQTDLHNLQQQQQQQQQQQRQYSAAPTLDQLLTDHDLGSKHRQPDRELKHMMSLDRAFGAENSRDGFTTASGCNRSSSSATAAAAAASAAAREQHSWHLSQMPYIPWDWSVKSSVRFSSAQPFNLLQEGQAGGLECLCQAVAAAGAGAASAGAVGSSYQERLQQALMQWQHPAAPLPPALLAAQASGSAGAVAAAASAAAAGTDRGRVDAAAVLLSERAQQWREALRGAYLALRHGHCPLVYVCGQAFKQSFTAVLCAPGVIGPSGSSSSSSKFTAVVSRTNRLLRSHLATYGCEVLVAGQLEQQIAATVPAGQDLRQGKQQQAQQQQSAAAFDGQPGSQLLLVGVQHVHALYAALLALPWCEPGQPDVPLLSAPVPFLHAQLCPLRLVALPDVLLDQRQAAAADAAAAAAGGGVGGVPLPLHYCELRAPAGLMPWTLHRLLSLLQDSQGLEGFQAFLGTEPCSSSLNVLPELWAAAAMVAAGGNCGSAEQGAWQQQQQQQQQQQWRREGRGFADVEVQAWGGSAGLLHGRVLRQLKLEEGSITAKLA